MEDFLLNNYAKQELINFWLEKGIVADERIILAFVKVPRESFMPSFFSEAGLAYHDHPIPTLRGQSLSQPTTIMIMLQALETKIGDKVLEIGSGMGYQAALLGYIVGKEGKVFSVEVMPELVAAAKKNIQQMQLQNVKILETDGSQGLAEEGPYDKIIVTAACPKIPLPLIEQLREGGILVAPVGSLEEQTLIKGVKNGSKLEKEYLGSFKFVPMVGRYGFDESEPRQEEDREEFFAYQEKEPDEDDNF